MVAHVASLRSAAMAGPDRVSRTARRALLIGGVSAAVLLAMTAAPALAQQTSPEMAVVDKLIQRLVARGVLDQSDADALLAQAKAEAARAAPQGQPPAPAAAAVAPGAVRVPYIPQTVRDEIKNEVRGEVMQQAKEEGWAAPGFPDWVRRIRWSGDLRARLESQYYDSGNFAGYLDFNSINNGGGLDVNPVTNPAGGATLNTQNDREAVARLRARLAVSADVAENVTATIRLATGSDGSPVSTNQTLGGGLSKKEIWLDRAYVEMKPIDAVTVAVGRLPNPFFTTELMFDDDLNFDGMAVSGTVPLGGAKLFATAGAFPLDFRSNNSPSVAADKPTVDNENRWLWAGQLGASWEEKNHWRVKGAAGYFFFDGVRGRLDPACEITPEKSYCATDGTRPGFMQKGNTLFLLRNLLFPTATNPDQQKQVQYFGLSQDFHILNVGLEGEASIGEGRVVNLRGDYVKNLGFSQRKAPTSGQFYVPVTNVNTADPDRYYGGDTGWMVRATVGHPTVSEPFQWNLSASYRRLESDAVLDAFTDSDFHLGGTNAKGYTVSGNLGLFHNVWLNARWLSADEVNNLPFSVDVLQIDLNAKF